MVAEEAGMGLSSIEVDEAGCAIANVEGDDSSAPTLPRSNPDAALLEDVAQMIDSEVDQDPFCFDGDNTADPFGACREREGDGGGAQSMSSSRETEMNGQARMKGKVDVLDSSAKNRNSSASTLSCSDPDIVSLKSDSAQVVGREGSRLLAELDDCESDSCDGRKKGKGGDGDDAASMKASAGKPSHPRLWLFVKVAISAIFLFLTANWVTVSHEWDQVFKSPAFPIKQIGADRWESTIENGVRLHESRDYVESIMGLPQICEAKECGDQSIKYETTTYINSYFSLFCVYVDETLKGFLLISNSEYFRPANYRVGFSGSSVVSVGEIPA